MNKCNWMNGHREREREREWMRRRASHSLQARGSTQENEDAFTSKNDDEDPSITKWWQGRRSGSEVDVVVSEGKIYYNIPFHYFVYLLYTKRTINTWKDETCSNLVPLNLSDSLRVHVSNYCCLRVAYWQRNSKSWKNSTLWYILLVLNCVPNLQLKRTWKREKSETIKTCWWLTHSLNPHHQKRWSKEGAKEKQQPPPHFSSPSWSFARSNFLLHPFNNQKLLPKKL